MTAAMNGGLHTSFVLDPWSGVFCTASVAGDRLEKNSLRCSGGFDFQHVAIVRKFATPTIPEVEVDGPFVQSWSFGLRLGLFPLATVSGPSE
jgi:hypothetical protein